jgi:hypothetical protein
VKINWNPKVSPNALGYFLAAFGFGLFVASDFFIGWPGAQRLLLVNCGVFLATFVWCFRCKAPGWEKPILLSLFAVLVHWFCIPL